MAAESKPCARCGRPAVKGYRYCYLCKSAVEHEMREASYLSRRPSRSPWRGPGAQEDQYETKFGIC
jgi:predicted amidophosphoribosyltransferase